MNKRVSDRTLILIYSVFLLFLAVFVMHMEVVVSVRTRAEHVYLAKVRSGEVGKRAALREFLAYGPFDQMLWQLNCWSYESFYPGWTFFTVPDSPDPARLGA